MSQASIHSCMSIHDGMGCKGAQREAATLMAVEYIMLWKWPVFSASQWQVVATFIGCNFPLEFKMLTNAG